MERIEVNGVPKAKEAMETLKSYVVFRTPKDIIRNMSPSRILEEEMKALKDLAGESLAKQIMDYETCRSKIQQIFQRVKDATTSFFVRTIIFM